MLLELLFNQMKCKINSYLWGDRNKLDMSDGMVNMIMNFRRHKIFKHTHKPFQPEDVPSYH